MYRDRLEENVRSWYYNQPIRESDTSVTAGIYNGPVELGLRKWKKEHLGPFQEFVDTEFNHKKKQKTLKNNIKRTVGVWEKNPDGTYETKEHDVHTIKKDKSPKIGGFLKLLSTIIRDEVSKK